MASAISKRSRHGSSAAAAVTRVGKFVEFHAAGLAQPSLPDRATIANMAPEYGATCGIFPVAARDYSLRDGDLVIAAITSRTNTSNPGALVAAGLLAQNAQRQGLQTKPWVKTSLAPGSQVVADYLEAAGLQTHLDALGFTIAGFGCTTCIGNSGPLKPEVAAAVDDIRNARVLGIFGDSLTKDHISPAGSIKEDGPAGSYLQSKGVEPEDFNNYGSRRGDHEVMMRGTFANIRVENLMLRDKQGGFTRHHPSGSVLSIYDAAMRYQADGEPRLVIGGTEYGTGSSRDWAAKGPRLLGVRAVIAESFERIHRNNLVCMGVLPLQSEDGVSALSLQLTGEETITITGVASLDKPGQRCELEIVRPGGAMQTAGAISRIDTDNELAYFKNGGVLKYVLRGMIG